MFPQGIYSMEGKVFVMIDFKKLVSSLNESYMKGTIIKLTNRKRAIISIISPKDKLDEKYQEKYENKMIELIKFLDNKGYEICFG